MKKLIIIPLLFLCTFVFGQSGVTMPGIAAPRHSVPKETYRYYGGAFHLVLDKDSANIVYSRLGTQNTWTTIQFFNASIAIGTTASQQPITYQGTSFTTAIYAVNPTTNRLINWPDASGEAVVNIKGSATLDFPSTAAQSSSEITITVTGAADGDIVSVGVPNASSNANSCYTARVSAANTVTVKFNNYSSSAIDPASGTFKVSVIK